MELTSLGRSVSRWLEFPVLKEISDSLDLNFSKARSYVFSTHHWMHSWFGQPVKLLGEPHHVGKHCVLPMLHEEKHLIFSDRPFQCRAGAIVERLYFRRDRLFCMK